MRIETQLKNREAARMAISELWSRAASFGFSHKRMLEERSAIYARHKIHAMPARHLAFLEGYWTAKQESAYRDSLVFGAWINGRFYSTHRTRPDYYDSNGISPRDFAELSKNRVTHYWADSLKPFGEPGA